MQDRNPLPVDDRTPYIGRLCFEDITCRNCHIAAAYFMGLPERKIGEVVMKNVSISFDKEAKSGVPAMLCGIEEMSKKGVIAENVSRLVLENVSIEGAEGEDVTCNSVDFFERN